MKEEIGNSRHFVVYILTKFCLDRLDIFLAISMCMYIKIVVSLLYVEFLCQTKDMNGFVNIINLLGIYIFYEKITTHLIYIDVIYIKNCIKTKLKCVLFVSKVPAFLLVTDIAGLVQGASEGKVCFQHIWVHMLLWEMWPYKETVLIAFHVIFQGLGNAFLSHISACDALFHVVSKYRNLIVHSLVGTV